MSGTRPTLRLKLPEKGKDPPLADVIIQAIREQLCIRATYNRGLIRMAPHILYTGHEALFVDAVVTERNGVAPVEPKLGAFRLSGLNGVAMTMEPFQLSALFDPTDERYAGKTIAAVEESQG
jgi:hypothetical protein